MDPDVYTFLAVCAVAVGSIGALVAIGVSARVRLLRAERGSNAPRIDENRLQHLEQAVDAVAIEVERIGEGQRYMTQALTGDSAPRALGAGAAEPVEVKQREAARVRR